MNELLTGFLLVLGGIAGLVVGIAGLLFLLVVLGKAADKKRPR